jgi:hypothetical protein
MFRFIACIAAFNGLQDNMRNVDAGHEIPVRLLLDHVGPTDGATAARLVLNDDFLPQYLFQVRLLPPGFQVGLPTRGKGNRISDGPGRILLLCQRRHCKRTHAEHYQNDGRELLHDDLPPRLQWKDPDFSGVFLWSMRRSVLRRPFIPCPHLRSPDAMLPFILFYRI